MSVWSDIQDRSAGNIISKEDMASVYPGKEAGHQTLDSGEYKKLNYTIKTNGEYPFITISTEQEISAFSGYQIIKLKDEDGKFYNLERIAKNNEVEFIYFCNQEKDYVAGVQDGIKYSVDMLRQMAEKFIDLILDGERELSSRMD